MFKQNIDLDEDNHPTSDGTAAVMTELDQMIGNFAFDETLIATKQ